MSARPGWMSEEEQAAIRSAARGAGDVLEIGTYCGRSTEVLLEASEGIVFTVDPFERGATVPSHPQQRAWVESLARAYPQRLIVIPGRSQDLIWCRPVDVLLIDGDHSFEGCATDLELLGQYVLPGGVLLLDDFLEDYPGVLRAWERYPLREEFEPIERVGKLALFRRRRVRRS